jgi:hypothetical protein
VRGREREGREWILLTINKRLKVGKFNALPGNTPLWALGMEKGGEREEEREQGGESWRGGR